MADIITPTIRMTARDNAKNLGGTGHYDIYRAHNNSAMYAEAFPHSYTSAAVNVSQAFIIALSKYWKPAQLKLFVNIINELYDNQQWYKHS